MLEVCRVADADDEGLHHSAALLYLVRHLADVAPAVVHAVGDDEDDVAGFAVAGEVVERVGECRSGGAAPVGDEGLDFALQLVLVVCFEGHLQLSAVGVLVKMAEHTESHLHIGEAVYAVEKAEQHLLSYLDFGFALPAVPHAVRAVENNQNTGFLGRGGRLLSHTRKGGQEQ